MIEWKQPKFFNGRWTLEAEFVPQVFYIVMHTHPAREGAEFYNPYTQRMIVFLNSEAVADMGAQRTAEWLKEDMHYPVALDEQWIEALQNAEQQ